MQLVHVLEILTESRGYLPLPVALCVSRHGRGSPFVGEVPFGSRPIDAPGCLKDGRTMLNDELPVLA